MSCDPSVLDMLKVWNSSGAPVPWSACGCGRCGLVWAIAHDVTVCSATSIDDKDAEDGYTAAQRNANAGLIAAARNALPDLLAIVEAAQKVSNEWREALEDARARDGIGVSVDLVEAQRTLRAALARLALPVPPKLRHTCIRTGATTIEGQPLPPCAACEAR